MIKYLSTSLPLSPSPLKERGIKGYKKRGEASL
jgi:hypothetical protein